LRKIFISSDHAGFKLKEAIKVYLSKKKLTFQDLGPHLMTELTTLFMLTK